MEFEDLRRIFGGETQTAEEKHRRWREKAEKEPGAQDTITISRVDFQDVIGEMFGDEMSNYDPETGIVAYRRLSLLPALVGVENAKKLNCLYAGLIEECIFGPQAGEPSRFRVDGQEAEEPAPRTELAAEALPMLAAEKIAEYCGDGDGELWLGKADYPHRFRAAMAESLGRDRALWDRIPDGTALNLMISVGCRIADELFRPYEADEETEGAE